MSCQGCECPCYVLVAPLRLMGNWRRCTIQFPLAANVNAALLLLLYHRWATRTLARWSSWWTNMASTTLSKSTPGSRLSTRSPKKSQSKQMFSICIRPQAGRQLDFCRACPRGAGLFHQLSACQVLLESWGVNGLRRWRCGHSWKAGRGTKWQWDCGRQ